MPASIPATDTSQQVIANMPPDAPLLLDVDGVARLLNLSRSGVYKLLAEKRLPKALKFGRRSLWPVDPLRRWVAAGCPPPARWHPAAR